MLDTAPIRAFLDEQHIALAARVDDFATRQLAPVAEPKDDAAASASRTMQQARQS